VPLSHLVSKFGNRNGEIAKDTCVNMIVTEVGQERRKEGCNRTREKEEENRRMRRLRKESEEERKEGESRRGEARGGKRGGEEKGGEEAYRVMDAKATPTLVYDSLYPAPGSSTVKFEEGKEEEALKSDPTKPFPARTQ
jgi:hypothetical protein